MENSGVSLANLHTGSFHWTVAGFPEITFYTRAMEGLLKDALEAFTRVPRRGAETGGILLGRKDQNGIAIQDFAPVPSEHCFGRLYRLSEHDRRHLRAACDAIARWPSGMEVVGLYRTHARDDRDPSEEDAEYVEDHLPEDRRVLLLVRPALSRPTAASFYFWNDGRMVEPSEPAAFPFQAMPAEREARQPEPAPAAIPIREPAPARLIVVPPPSPPPAPTMETPVPPRHVELPPPPRLRMVEPAKAPGSGFHWSAIACLFVAAVAAGYLSQREFATRPAAVSPPAPPAPRYQEMPSTPAPPIPAATPPATSIPAALPPPAPAAAVETRDREAIPGPRMEVRTVLDRWSEAVRQGRVERAAGYYAPSARVLARANIAAKLGRAPRMDVFRLSSIGVEYPEPGEAVASFREHWQSGVAEKTAGEQTVRLTLRTDGDGWHIVSEQVEKVHWVQKVR